jgi:hypothetical protein
MTTRNGDHRMNLVLRIATIAVALLIGVASGASATTTELTLTVPLTITLPAPDAKPPSPAIDQTGPAGGGRLKAFDVNCAIGSNLAYATGTSGVQGNVVGRGSTATSGTKVVQGPDGKLVAKPLATVIITYDDGVGPNTVAQKPTPNYLCYVAWTTPIPSLAPIFVQGNLPKQTP